MLARFVEEARLLAGLQHPNIVSVLGAFEALGTAYYVMPWVGGQELHKAAPPASEITEAWLLPVLRALLDALGYLHSCNIYHRDVKPANILLAEDGAPVLIDFGTARLIISERSATQVGTPGYSPVEQLSARGKRGPWTDVYSLGATCYRLITGTRPPEATDRLSEDDDSLISLAKQAELRGRFSAEFLATIDKALELRAKSRWQTAAEWLAALPEPAASDALPPIPGAASRNIETSALDVQGKKRKKKGARKAGSRALLVVGSILGLLLAGVAVHAVMDDSGSASAKKVAKQEKAKKQRQKWKEKMAEAERLEAAQQYEQLVKLLQPLAEEGCAPAQLKLALCYADGAGVSVNMGEAVKWLRKAADRGEADAQNKLGVCYATGRGVSQSYSEALAWFRKSADQGNVMAQNNLGDCYANGDGVTQDYAEAAKWYHQAAEQGLPAAQNTIGNCYYNGNNLVACNRTVSYCA